MQTPPPFNPSQAVERIREIIVGRHLERLEQRIAKLEVPTSRQAGADLTQLTFFEDRILANEARLEALHANVTRMADSQREENERRAQIQRDDTQRLAAQIQQIASTRMTAAPTSHDIAGLERKLGTWLADWQKSLSQHLDARENNLAGKLRSEVAQLRETMETQLMKLQSRSMDPAAVEQRFSKIAEAARALAECATPFPVESTAAPR